jgi:uncharacterized protein (DUF2147 family)
VVGRNRTEPAAGDEPASAITGNWLTELKDGIIQIAPTQSAIYEGRIVGGNHPGRLDSMNPDPAQRGKPLRGQIILRDLHYDGNGKWSGGTIYDPNSGHTYRCQIEMTSADTLLVRGFIGVPLLGKQQTWHRYRGAAMDLPAS